tara:strand:+ start:304 stop:468 length:165 start_codon:yes stop_codon:yes gene_type:complete
MSLKVVYQGKYDEKEKLMMGYLMVNTVHLVTIITFSDIIIITLSLANSQDSCLS